MTVNGPIVLRLSRTLRRIARLGRKGFYEGLVLKKILATSKKYNGILSKADFSNYQVKWRNPVKGTFRGLEIFSMPPPSSGGIHVLQILNQLENMPLEKYGPLSAQSIHLTASAMQIAYADRAVYPGDPDFVQVPTERLVSKAYAEDRGTLISETRAKKSSEIKAGEPLRPELISVASPRGTQ